MCDWQDIEKIMIKFLLGAEQFFFTFALLIRYLQAKELNGVHTVSYPNDFWQLEADKVRRSLPWCSLTYKEPVTEGLTDQSDKFTFRMNASLLYLWRGCCLETGFKYSLCYIKNTNATEESAISLAVKSY